MQRSHVHRLSRRGPRLRQPLTWAVLAACPCLLALGCGGAQQEIGTKSLERSAQQTILAQRGVPASVSCPARVPRRMGFTFSCQARLDVGSYPLRVTETDTSGRFRYANPTPLVVLDITKVERSIGRLLARRGSSGGAPAVCPAYVIQRAGVRFECSARRGDRTVRFLVSEVNSDGRVRYVELL